MTFRFVEQWPWSIALVSARPDGSMRFSDASQNGTTGENRRVFLTRNGLSPGNLVRAQLVHGNNVHVVGADQRGRMMMSTDGLVTSVPDVLLGITVADCVPVFFVDPNRRAIGLTHAGWRGLANGIIERTVERLVGSFGTKPNQLWAGIGPCVGPCHYEIGPDVADQFSGYDGVIETREQRTFLDLRAVARQQLVRLGVPIGQIETSPDCTYCDPVRYFSYRRDKPEELETMMAVLGLRRV